MRYRSKVLEVWRHTSGTFPFCARWRCGYLHSRSRGLREPARTPSANRLARSSYLYARIVVGRELSMPGVQLSDVDDVT
jgi:hypothetical protein